MKNEGKHLVFREHLSSDTVLERKVKRVVKELKDIQNSYIIETPTWGSTLFIDGCFQSSEVDYHIYHEALVHPALFSHPKPKKVLIVGGGELCTLKEVLKHKEVELVDMVDIDEKLVESCKANLTAMHDDCFKDKRAVIHYKDIKDFVNSFESKDKYDVVIYDLVDPLEGEEVSKLYTKEMFETIKNKIMNKGAVFTMQATAFYLKKCFTTIRLRKTLEKVFGKAIIYSSFIPSFKENWGFIIANFDKSLENDLKKGKGINEKITKKKMESVLKFYDEESHIGMFTMGKDMRKIVADESIEEITMSNLPKFY